MVNLLVTNIYATKTIYVLKFSSTTRKKQIKMPFKLRIFYVLTFLSSHFLSLDLLVLIALFIYIYEYYKSVTFISVSIQRILFNWSNIFVFPYTLLIMCFTVNCVPLVKHVEGSQNIFYFNVYQIIYAFNISVEILHAIYLL